MDVQVIDSERGQSIPEGIGPVTGMLQIDGGRLLIVLTDKDVFVRRGKVWKRATNWIPPKKAQDPEPAAETDPGTEPPLPM